MGLNPETKGRQFKLFDQVKVMEITATYNFTFFQFYGPGNVCITV